MKYKNYVLLRIYENVYITKGNYSSQVYFQSFEEAQKYIDSHEYVEVFPPEFSLLKNIPLWILYTIYIYSAYYLFHSKYYIYPNELFTEWGNNRILFLIGIELVRILFISLKYTYLYFSKKEHKISFSEKCTTQNFILILVDKNFDLLLLVGAFVIMLFTSNIIFALLPIALFIRGIARWQRSLNYAKMMKK